MDRLEEIRQRTEAATDGPWERFDTPDYAEIHVLGGKEAGFLPVALADKAYNADFIAHSREDIPYLLSEVDRLNAMHKREINITGEYAQRVIDLTARAQPAEPPVRCGECANYQTQNCAAKHEQALMDFCSHGVRRPHRKDDEA